MSDASKSSQSNIKAAQNSSRSKQGNKLFGVMTKRRWFGVLVFLSAMLWTYTAGPPLHQAIISNRYFKDGVTYDYSTVRFEGDLRLIDSLFKRGFWPYAFTWQIGAYFNWTEGPTFMPNSNTLLFSDVIKNRIYSYAPIQGIQILMENSGDCNQQQIEKYSLPGSNGLLLHPTEENVIFIAQHCRRRIISFNLETKEKIVIASNFDGKRFNSPNDMILGKNGEYIYFTDPGYGLIQNKRERKQSTEHSTKNNTYIDNDSALGFSGVFRVHISANEKNGKNSMVVQLLDDSIHRPNGIAFSTDFKKLFVANSIVEELEIIVYDVNGDGSVSRNTVWNEEFLLRNSKNLATPIGKICSGSDSIDGITVHPWGYLIITAPDGKLGIIDEKTGDMQALIKMADLLIVTNVEIGSDENLYVTGNHTVWQLKLQPFDKDGNILKSEV